ncbi:hypothetical protein QL285_059380 [Trifolium repens]|nr:hypothetical protein QL285_059380 [Trifolium repens]
MSPSNIFHKRVIPSVSGQEMSPSNILHKRVILSVSVPEMSSSNIFQVAGFANNQFANLHLNSPKAISSVSGQDNTFLYVSCSPTLTADNVFPFCVLLFYIDSRQCFYFMSCSPTLTADIVFYSSPCSLTLTADNVISFISCLALLHRQRTMSFPLFHALLSYIDSRQCLHLLSRSLTLTANNITLFILWLYSLTLTVANDSSFHVSQSVKLPYTNGR